MEILMSHVRDAEARTVAGELRSHGHTVVTCDDESSVYAFCCAALRGDPCPIEFGHVDAVVHVTEDVATEPAITDEGVLCALRQHIPLVVVTEGGSVVTPPHTAFASWAAAVCGLARLEETLADVAGRPLELHSVAACEAANDVLAVHGIDASYDAEVRREGGHLHIDLVAAGEVPEAVAEAAAIRAHDAVRLVDDKNPAVDVSFADAAPAR